MRFIEIISQKKFALIGVFLFLYIILNLLDGERGLISYYEKETLIKTLSSEKKSLENKLYLIEKKNNLLTGIIDLDYLEILYRKKFMVGSLVKKFILVIINEDKTSRKS